MVGLDPAIHRGPWGPAGDARGCRCGTGKQIMDFDFSEEQRLLRDSVNRLLADHYTFDKRKAYLAEPDGWSRALWAQYAELGLLGLPFAEEHGGFGGGPV